MQVAAKRESVPIDQGLVLADFRGLMAELVTYRAYRSGEAGSGAHDTDTQRGVLPFVCGLRLSARLIYILRKRIHGTGLHANWGHVIDPGQHILSRECDIIIHRGSFDRWNDHEQPVMDFHFVASGKVVAVISCKSFLQTVDEVYVKDLKPFVKKVYLFAEYCRAKDRRRLAKHARRVGYRGVWYLYTLEEDGDRPPADRVVLDFVAQIQKLTVKKGRQ